MKTIMRAIMAIGLAVMPVLGASSAQATQLNHTWVASAAAGGSDSNNCDRPTPCADFSTALTRTAAGGEITCVDSADYGAVSIDQSITINCENAIGSSTVSGGTARGGVTISGTAATDVVVLRGLDLDGLGSGSGDCNNGAQITFLTNSAGTLHVDKVKINARTGNCDAIQFTPGGAAKLFVSDSDITDTGSTATAAGIYIKPASGVTADVSISHSRINNNYFGIVADGTQGGTILATISDSIVSGNTEDGIAATSSGSTVRLLVDQAQVSGNAYGLAAGGSGTEILARNTSVFGNTTGLHTGNGGAIYSYGNNSVNGNTTNGTFTGTVGLQ